jgi:hypothetical protein
VEQFRAIDDVAVSGARAGDEAYDADTVRQRILRVIRIEVLVPEVLRPIEE